MTTVPQDPDIGIYLDYMRANNRLTLPSSGDVTRMVILGLLTLGPNHGYGLREVIEAWKMDKWADVSYGSIYPALKRMSAEGLVEPLGASRSGQRPPRTLFRITDSGRESLRGLLTRAWSGATRYVEIIDVALSFSNLGLIPDAEIVSLLELRLRRLGEFEELLHDDERTTLAAIDSEPVRQAAADHFRHFQELIAAERVWTEHVRAQVIRGAYRI